LGRGGGGGQEDRKKRRESHEGGFLGQDKPWCKNGMTTRGKKKASIKNSKTHIERVKGGKVLTKATVAQGRRAWDRGVAQGGKRALGEWAGLHARGRANSRGHFSSNQIQRGTGRIRNVGGNVTGSLIDGVAGGTRGRTNSKLRKVDSNLEKPY